jgi:ribose transport system substrate-binding protein
VHGRSAESLKVIIYKGVVLMTDDTIRDGAIQSPLDKKISRSGVLKAGAVAAAGLAGVTAWPRGTMAAPAQVSKKYRIAIVPKGLDNPVFNTANWGGAWRAKELGDVEFTYTGSAVSDAAPQVTVMDGLIAAGYDGIGISCNAPAPLQQPIDYAIKKGITVMTWDSDSPKSKRPVFYGVDGYACGQLESKLVNGWAAGKAGKVWVLSGDAGADNLNQRVAGVKNALAKNLTIVETAYAANDSAQICIQDIELAVTKYPDLTAMIWVGGWPLFTNATLPNLTKATKAGLKVVSFDYLAPELPWVQRGQIEALVGQDYWGWGYESVQIIHELLKGKKFPAFVPQASPVVTKANIGPYVHLWQVAKDPASAAVAFNALLHDKPIMGK